MSVPGCVSGEIEVTINATPTTYTPVVVHPGCGETRGTIEFSTDTDYEYAIYQSGETQVYRGDGLHTDGH